MKKLTRDEFLELTFDNQVEYINKLSNLYNGCDFVKVEDRFTAIDIDSDEEIENLFDYLLDLNYEYTDLHNKCFADEE